MLKLSLEKPIKESGGKGYARYRIDFEDLKDSEYYVLGWVTPWISKKSGSEIEAREFLYNISDWKEGIVKEIYQDDLFEVQRFKVRLYRAGLIPLNNEEPEGFLLEEREYGSQQPLD